MRTIIFAFHHLSLILDAWRRRKKEPKERNEKGNDDDNDGDNNGNVTDDDDDDDDDDDGLNVYARITVSLLFWQCQYDGCHLLARLAFTCAMSDSGKRIKQGITSLAPTCVSKLH